MEPKPEPNAEGAGRGAAMPDEFYRLFKEKFGREYERHKPLLSLSEPEFEFATGYIFRQFENFLYQFTYTDPVTKLTYEVFYDVNVDEDKAIVAHALLEEKKVKLTRGLKQRMTRAAFQQWLKEGLEECGNTWTTADCAFVC